MLPWAALLLLLLPQAVAAESRDVRRVEAVGVFAIDPELPSIEAPRDAAVRSAVQEAVQRTARALLPADFRPPVTAEATPDAAAPTAGAEPDPQEQVEAAAALAAWLDRVLGDPFDYATRFRILKDRGVRPALLTGRSDVTSEYVVDVEVFVDAGRVNERLRAQGALEAPAGGNAIYHTRVILEGADSFAGYDAVRRALRDGPGVQSALPSEFAKGQIVIEVTADREASAVLDDLLGDAPAGLQLVPLESSSESITLLVHFTKSAPAAGREAEGAAAAAPSQNPHD
jgi:hypothetical protein